MALQQTLPPHNIDAEEAVIGSILIDGECIVQIHLIPDNFFSSALRVIYHTMLEMRGAGIVINELTVAEALNSRQRLDAGKGTKLEEIGGVAYLSHLISSTPTSLDIEHYADIIKRCSFYRNLLIYASQVGGMATLQDPNTGLALDKCETMLKELRNDVGLVSRTLELGQPRLIQTSPPRYIWNVNGKDLRLTLKEITQWGIFKNRVIAELNFVPIKPKDWDNAINKLITTSTQIEAPIDASEEQQLKITIAKWFERMREASLYSDLSIGRHVVKDFGGLTYYCFQSTPLLDYLKKDHKKNLVSQDLWVSVIKWGGVKRQLRVKTPTGSMPVNLWCLPIDFIEETKKTAPDWF